MQDSKLRLFREIFFNTIFWNGRYAISQDFVPTAGRYIKKSCSPKQSHCYNEKDKHAYTKTGDKQSRYTIDPSKIFLTEA